MSVLSGLRVLVVDDEADIRLGLRLLIEPLGAHVSAASSGAEALEVIEGEGADLVLTDLQMPGMSGVRRCVDTARHRRHHADGG